MKTENILKKKLNFKAFSFFIVLGIVAFIQIGYSALNQTLYISGSADATPSKGVKLFYAPMDGNKSVNPNVILAPFIDSVGNINLIPKTRNTVHTTLSSIMGTKSVHFGDADGEGSRIEAPVPNLNFGVNDFTISFWLNPDAQKESNALVFGGGATDIRFFLTSQYNSGRMRFAYKTNNVVLLNSSKAYTAGAWTHYAITRSAGVFYFYENGVQLGTNTANKTAPVDLSGIYIGSSNDVTRSYLGYMDDFAVYSYAKWTAPFTPPTTPQTDADLFYLDFEDPASTGTGDPLDEVISGGKFTAGGISGNKVLTGQSDNFKFGGSSLLFGTSSEEIQINTPNLNFGTSDFTISFWVNPLVQPSSAFPILFTDTANTLRIFLAHSNGTIRVMTDAGSNTLISTSKKYTANVWTHYALVRSSGVFTLYENGVSIGTNATETTRNINFADVLIGNGTSPDRSYLGYMDDLVIFRGAVWTSNFTPPTTAGGVS